MVTNLNGSCRASFIQGKEVKFTESLGGGYCLSLLAMEDASMTILDKML